MKLTKCEPLFDLGDRYLFQAQYDEIGREAVKKILSDYKTTRVALNVLNPKAKRGPIDGSNIYSKFALGNTYRELSGQDVLPLDLMDNSLVLYRDLIKDWSETYEDLGLIVYPGKGYNPALWKHLREIAQSDFDNSVDLPFVITGLMDVIKDDKFEYGLRLDPTEFTEMYNVSIPDQKPDIHTPLCFGLKGAGFPIDLLWAESNGVCRRYRYGYYGSYRHGNFDLIDKSGDLVYSNTDGRMHYVVENFNGNLDDLVDGLEQKKAEHKRMLDKEEERRKLKEAFHFLSTGGRW
ncbi:MAG TPA: hypothetical protein VJI98_06345 [Candidatus Nanoarchaeia archaeon]|nr:hypothetical protein [Candidatus Nanoarchaeia archaeon]